LNRQQPRHSTGQQEAFHWIFPFSYRHSLDRRNCEVRIAPLFLLGNRGSRIMCERAGPRRFDRPTRHWSRASRGRSAAALTVRSNFDLATQACHRSQARQGGCV
jgi:hypothetical protein